MLRTLTILTAFLVAATLSMMAHVQAAPTLVTTCPGTISAPGVFILQNDLTADANTNCFDVVRSA